MKRSVLCSSLLFAAIAVAGCADTAPTAVEPGGPLFSNHKSGGGGTTTPVHHWKFPTADAALGLRSDGIPAYVSTDGAYNVYKDGVCGVHATFQAGGDATMQTNNAKFANRKCPDYPRKIQLVYPADDREMGGKTEEMEAFFNLNDARDIQGTVERGFNLNPSQTTRCDRWMWRSQMRDGTPVPGDNVVVTRIDANTLHVKTKPWPDNRAVCSTTGTSHHLSVDLLIVVE